VFGHLKSDAVILKEAQAVLQEVLKPLEDHLLLNTWLVGAHLTLADVSLAATLLNAYRVVFDSAWRSKFPNLTRWFTTVAGQTSFREVVGRVHLCAVQQTPPGDATDANKSKQQNQPKKDDNQKQQQSNQPKKGKGEQKQPQKKEEKEEEVVEQPQKKAKNPLEELPPTSFDIETWKRQYSNNAGKGLN